jgi:hypothetical protein
VDEKSRVAVVLGRERGVVMDPVKKPGGGAEHEEVDGCRGALLDGSFFADAGQGAHR